MQVRPAYIDTCICQLLIGSPTTNYDIPHCDCRLRNRRQTANTYQNGTAPVDTRVVELRQVHEIVGSYWLPERVTQVVAS